MKLTVAAFAASVATMVNAKAQFTNSAFDIVAGQAFNLTWSDSTGTGPFTITLKTGDANNLQTVQTLTSTSDFSYVFTPDSSLTTGTYAFQIDDSTGEPNYSAQWAFEGSAAASSSSVSSSASSTASASSSSASSKTSTDSITSSTTSSNSTTTASSSSSSHTGSATTTSSASATSSRAATTSVANTNGVQRISSSPLALLLGSVAALAFFN